MFPWRRAIGHTRLVTGSIGGQPILCVSVRGFDFEPFDADLFDSESEAEIPYLVIRPSIEGVVAVPQGNVCLQPVLRTIGIERVRILIHFHAVVPDISINEHIGFVVGTGLSFDDKACRIADITSTRLAGNLIKAVPLHVAWICVERKTVSCVRDNYITDPRVVDEVRASD
jgi:hypothetical protein